MNRQKFHVKKGDTVQVTTGNHRGSQGKVLAVLPKKSQVLIEGVRLIKKHTRKSQDHPQGAIIEREGPLHISNVKKIEIEAPAKAAKPAKASKPKAAKKSKE